MTKKKSAQPDVSENIEQTPDLPDELNELDRELFHDRNARARERWAADMEAPNFFTCSNDGTVLKLHGIFKYLHSTNVLASGEHWECPDCGYVCWRYLAPGDRHELISDDFPF